MFDQNNISEPPTKKMKIGEYEENQNVWIMSEQGESFLQGFDDVSREDENHRDVEVDLEDTQKVDDASMILDKSSLDIVILEPTPTEPSPTKIYDMPEIADISGELDQVDVVDDSEESEEPEESDDSDDDSTIVETNFVRKQPLIDVSTESNENARDMDIIILESTPTEPAPTKRSNMSEALDIIVDDSEDELAVTWDSRVEKEPDENFEKGPVILSVGDLKKMSKKGQMVKDLDVSKVDILSDTCSIEDMFDPNKASTPQFIATSFEPEAILVVHGNHRLAALSERDLTDSEKSVKVACTIIIVPKNIFEKAWNNLKTLEYSDIHLMPTLDLDRSKLPQSIIEIYIRSIPRNHSFTLKNQVHAYMIYFEKMFSEAERIEFMNDVHKRNQALKKLLEWDTDKRRRKTQEDLFRIFCMPEFSKNVIVESLKNGYKFPTGSHFVSRLFSIVIQNDFPTSLELFNERYNPNPRTRQELLRIIVRMAEDDGTIEGKPTTKRSVMRHRYNKNGIVISNIEEATSNGFIVFNKSIPNIDIMNAKNFNAFVVEPDGDAKKVQGGYGSGTFLDDKGRSTVFAISGHLVKNDVDDKIKKRVFDSIASAIHGYTVDKRVNKGSIFPIYRMDRTEPAVTIDSSSH